MRSQARQGPRRSGASAGGDQPRARRKLEGAAALELALVLPFFTLLLLGGIDFGHLFFVKSVITNAAREGARAGAVQTTTGLRDSVPATTAQSYLTHANLYGAGCKIDCATVTETYNTNPVGGFNVEVTVSVAGTFKNISGFKYAVLPGFGNPFSSITNLNAKSQMRWESAP